jgi:hypothetical protein
MDREEQNYQNYHSLNLSRWLQPRLPFLPNIVDARPMRGNAQSSGG